MKDLNVIPAVSVLGRYCSIVRDGAEFKLYTLDKKGGLADALAAHGFSSWRLGDYALAAGALEVRHDYDLAGVRQ